MQISKRKIVVGSIIIMLVLISTLFFQQKKANSNKPKLEQFELVLRKGKIDIDKEQRPTMDAYIKYKIKIEEEDKNLYSVYIKLPEEMTNEFGYDRMTWDIIDTDERVIESYAQSMVQNNSNVELPEKYSFKVFLQKDDKIIQELVIENSFTSD